MWVALLLSNLRSVEVSGSHESLAAPSLHTVHTVHTVGPDLDMKDFARSRQVAI